MKTSKFTIEKLSNSPALRLKFYKKLLDVVCKDPSVDDGYCLFIAKITEDDSYDVIQMIEIYAPELAAYMPTDFYVYWFPCTKEGWQKRINILVKIINKMEKSAKK